jgi:hypothetical protein
LAPEESAFNLLEPDPEISQALSECPHDAKHPQLQEDEQQHDAPNDDAGCHQADIHALAFHLCLLEQLH